MRCSRCNAEVEFTYFAECDFAGGSEIYDVAVKHEPDDTGPLCLPCLLEHLRSMVTQAETADVADDIE